MKKYLSYILLTLLISAAPSFAGFRAGIKAGANFSKINAKNNSRINYKQQTGYGVGPMVAFDFSRYSALRTELLFIQKGAKFHDPAGDGTLRNDEVVLAPFYLINLTPGMTKLFLQAGPEVGFNTLHDVSHSSGNSIVKDWKNQNYSLNFGAGLAFPLGTNTFEVDARYNFGLVDINDDVDGNGKLRTSGFQLFLGYYLLDFGAKADTKTEKY